MRQPLPATLTAAAAVLALSAVTTTVRDARADLAPVDFTIDAGRVVPATDFAVKVSVLGAALTEGVTGPSLPVTVRVHVGDQSFEPFGGFTDPDAGNVNNGTPARHFVLPDLYAALDSITVTGRSWTRSGSSNLEANSTDPTPLVHVLRDGDPVPDTQGFGSQNDIAFFVQQYVVDGKMHLHENQAIYLMELGTTDLHSAAADYQDLVVLVTLGESVDALRDPIDPGTTVEPLFD